MEEEKQNQPDTLPVPQEEIVLPAPDEKPQLEAHTRPPVGRIIVGALFLTVSITGGMGLIAASIPVTSSKGEVQVAAAQTTLHTEIYDTLLLGGKGMYIVDLTNDRVLFSRNPDTQLPLASLTKVALALVVSEVITPDEIITISRNAVIKGEGGLTMDEEWIAKDLIEYMLIASSNTAAEALAEAADARLREKYPEAPRGEAAVWRMNALAQYLGLHATYFVNPSGLDESTTQAGALGSAKDTATLFAHAMRSNRGLFAGTARNGEVLGPINMPKKEAHNTNIALSSIPNIIMGKTGLTDLAGGNLGIIFDAGIDHPIVIIVLGSSPDGRFDDMKKLVTTTLEILSNGEISE